MKRLFEEIKNELDGIMLKCMHSPVLIYGYDNYTGRFLKWYAEYYHSIKIDWLVSEDMTTGKGYDLEVFRPSVFEFGYQNIKNAVVWIAVPLTEELREKLVLWGYKENISFFDFYEAVYGDDYYWDENETQNPFKAHKTGRRDIQFLEWLEWKYGCEFLTPISKNNFESVDFHGSRYSCSTQKEIFPILDKCHTRITDQDAILDFGCGKGGAMVSFLDYGFRKVGGVEYENQIYNRAKQNFDLLGINNIELICGDATRLQTELDSYNWFYFFYPFDMVIMKKVIDNIVDSYRRNIRKLRIIYYTAMDYTFIEQTGVFRLTNQFTVDSRQRVVAILETK